MAFFISNRDTYTLGNYFTVKVHYYQSICEAIKLFHLEQFAIMVTESYTYTYVASLE